MEGFKNGRKIPESEYPEKNVYAEVNSELRDIIRGLPSIDKGLRKTVFDRMLQGPDMLTEDPILEPFFEQIAAIEERYGRERVAEMATFYVTPEPAV